MSRAFDNDAYIPVRRPLHRLRNLAFIRSIEDIRRKPTETATLRLQETIHSSGQAGVISKQWCADGLRLVLVEDTRGPVGLHSRARVRRLEIGVVPARRSNRRSGDESTNRPVQRQPFRFLGPCKVDRVGFAGCIAWRECCRIGNTCTSKEKEFSEEHRDDGGCKELMRYGQVVTSCSPYIRMQQRAVLSTFTLERTIVVIFAMRLRVSFAWHPQSTTAM